jgi:hypothetical protein
VRASAPRQLCRLADALAAQAAGPGHGCPALRRFSALCCSGDLDKPRQYSDHPRQHRAAVTDLEVLANHGLVTVGRAAIPGPKTLVVVGVGRGGTSIVAGALAALGVFMGDGSEPPVFEDVRLAEAMEASDLDRVRSIVAEYDRRSPVWAFKRPSIIRRLEMMHAVFRNPVYLFVFRDILCVANRNVLSMYAELLPSLRQPLEHYARILDFIEHANPSGLLISTEKALLHRDRFVLRLVEFGGLEQSVSAERLQQAIDFIQVDSPDYLDKSRLRFDGAVHRATPESVGGWACIRNQRKPATVVISVNGQRVGTAVADQLRPRLKERGIHPTGACGFQFDFPADQAPEPGDRVTVQFELGGVQLRRSPIGVEPA